jgi:tetratricopeptide (TPR) repeat protein
MPKSRRSNRTFQTTAAAPQSPQLPTLSRKRSWQRNLIICVGLLLLVALAYCSAGRNEFVNFDDSDYVVENEYVNEGLTLHNIYVAFSQPHAANWHPITWISHMIDCQLFTLRRPGAHHLTSVAIHAANSVLVFLVLLRMTGAAWPSAAVAALFAVHPLHVESVAWVAERKDVLSTLFGLAALWAWLGYVARPGVLRYLAVVAWYAASLMSKSMLVTFPFLLLLLDWWPLERFGRSPALPFSSSAALPFCRSQPLPRVSIPFILLEKLPLALMSLASCAITLYAQTTGHAVVPFGYHAIAARLTTVADAYCGYLGKMFVLSRLAPIYPMPKTPNYWIAAGSAVGLAIVTALLLWASPRRKYLAVGWLWYLGTLVPVIGLVQVGRQSMADRYTYVPAIGIFIILAWSAADAIRRWQWLKPPLTSLAAAAVAVCCVLCNAQVRLWASTKTLFEHTVAVTENNAIALTNLGVVALNEDRLADAERYLRESLRLDPGDIDTWGNVANLCRKQGKLDDAISAYRTIDKLCPGNAKCLNLMAGAFESRGKLKEAATCLEAAIKAEPESISYRVTLAQILQREGMTAEALKAYLKIVDLRPEESRARNNAAWILATSVDGRLRNGPKAIELLMPAAQRSDCDSNLLDTLAAAQAEAGQYDRAVETAQRAIAKARGESLPSDAIADMTKRLELYKKQTPYREGK